MTPHDWALLSEWLDGGLTAERRAELEARLAREPELAEAARRLKALSKTAQALAPTDADAETWRRSTRGRWPLRGGVLGLVLLGAAVAWHGAGELTPSTRPVVLAADAGPVAPLLPPGEPRPLAGADGGASPDGAGGTAPVPVSPASPSRGAHPMPVRLDASTPLVVAALLATAAQAGPPVTVHVNPGEPWLVHAPLSAVSVSPAGVVEVGPLGASTTRIFSKQPAVVQVTTTPTDGGTPRVVELHVEARRDPEFTVQLDVGAKRHVWAPGRVRFAVGSSAIARALEEGDRLRLEGVREGETTLEAWFSDGAHLTWPIRVTAASSDDTIELPVGRQKVLMLQSGEKARLEDGTLARVQALGGRQVLLVGQKPGSTTLVVSGADGEVRSKKKLVVRGAELDAVPLDVQDVTLAPDQREQGPWRVRQNRALRFSSRARFERVRSRSEVVNVTFRDGVILVQGAAPGRVVLEVAMEDGTEVQVSVIVDP